MLLQRDEVWYNAEQMWVILTCCLLGNAVLQILHWNLELTNITISVTQKLRRMVICHLTPVKHPRAISTVLPYITWVRWLTYQYLSRFGVWWYATGTMQRYYARTITAGVLHLGHNECVLRCTKQQLNADNKPIISEAPPEWLIMEQGCGAAVEPGTQWQALTGPALCHP